MGQRQAVTGCEVVAKARIYQVFVLNLWDSMRKKTLKIERSLSKVKKQKRQLSRQNPILPIPPFTF
jgi:hypothetical protein